MESDWITCPAKCGKWMPNSKQVISRHLNKEHAGETESTIAKSKFPCLLCHNTFTRSTNLCRHQKRQHDLILATPNKIITTTPKPPPTKSLNTNLPKYNIYKTPVFKIQTLPTRCRDESIQRHRQRESRKNNNNQQIIAHQEKNQQQQHPPPQDDPAGHGR